MLVFIGARNKNRGLSTSPDPAATTQLYPYCRPLLLRTAGITIYNGFALIFQIILGDLFHVLAMRRKN